MKNAFLGFAFVSAILLPSFAHACQQEAQYMGKAKNVIIEFGLCTYEIEYTYFNHSRVCPLDEAEVYGTIFVDESCSLTDGSEVSGIITKKDGRVNLE